MRKSKQNKNHFHTHKKNILLDNWCNYFCGLFWFLLLALNVELENEFSPFKVFIRMQLKMLGFFSIIFSWWWWLSSVKIIVHTFSSTWSPLHRCKLISSMRTTNFIWKRGRAKMWRGEKKHRKWMKRSKKKRYWIENHKLNKSRDLRNR